jgi:predicted phosphodiesterase
VQIAFIGDIHGNLPALEAVLADLARLKVDEIWCHGDICYGGPWPHQCAELVRAVCSATTRGNGEDLIANAANQGEIARRDRLEIGEELVSWLSRLPTEHDAHGLTLTHATRRSNKERPPAMDAEDGVWLAAYGPSPAIVICGHGHIAFMKESGADLRVLNTGSVGGPLDGDPRASYLIGTLDHHSWSFRHGRSDYDRQTAARAFEGLRHFEGTRWAHAIRTGRHP